MSAAKGLRKEVFEADGYRCRSCGTQKRLTIDHILPLARGGTGARANLQTLCRPCNNAKGCSIEDEASFPIVRKLKKKHTPWHPFASRRNRERVIDGRLMLRRNGEWIVAGTAGKK